MKKQLAILVTGILTAHAVVLAPAMKPHYLLIALTIGTFILPATKPSLVLAQPVQLTQNNTEENERKVEVQSIAAKVTVRIKIGQGTGSGVLIAKKGNTYLVMTNAHVVRDKGSITLQTPDRQSYAARKVQNTQVGNFDVHCWNLLVLVLIN